MVINKIITQKELNYIETLYLYCNLQDFATEINFIGFDGSFSVDDIQSGIVYRHMLAYYYDTLLSSSEYIGESNGRMWYKFDNYRLGIMDYELAVKSNQFNIEIQYEQSHMFSLDPMLKGLDLPFDGTLDQYHIKRVDVSQIVKTPQDYLTNHSYISTYRTEARIKKNNKTETMYLGNRKSGNVFRMYNKTVELKTDNKEHPMDYRKIEMFSKYFGDIENLYTFELELHRKYIKPTFGIDTLEDLEKVYRAYSDIVGKIRIYEDTDQNKKHIKNKDYDRIGGLLRFTEYKEFKRLNSKRYKPSESYMVDKVITAFNRYEDSLKEPLREFERLAIVDKILLGIFVNNDDVTIELHDDDKEELMHKIEALRNSQGNDLNVEAKRAFRLVAHNPNPFC